MKLFPQNKSIICWILVVAIGIQFFRQIISLNLSGPPEVWLVNLLNPGALICVGAAFVLYGIHGDSSKWFYGLLLVAGGLYGISGASLLIGAMDWIENIHEHPWMETDEKAILLRAYRSCLWGAVHEGLYCASFITMGLGACARNKRLVRSTFFVLFAVIVFYFIRWDVFSVIENHRYISFVFASLIQMLLAYGYAGQAFLRQKDFATGPQEFDPGAALRKWITIGSCVILYVSLVLMYIAFGMSQNRWGEVVLSDNAIRLLRTGGFLAIIVGSMLLPGLSYASLKTSRWRVSLLGSQTWNEKLCSPTGSIAGWAIWWSFVFWVGVIVQTLIYVFFVIKVDEGIILVKDCGQSDLTVPLLGASTAILPLSLILASMFEKQSKNEKNAWQAYQPHPDNNSLSERDSQLSTSTSVSSS